MAYVAGPIWGCRTCSSGVRRISPAARAVRLGDTALGSEWLPQWSPDGQICAVLGLPRGSGFGPRRAPGGRPASWEGCGPATLPPRARVSAWLAWSPDGTRVAFVARRYDLHRPRRPTPPRDASRSRPPDTPDLHSLAWSPDGKRIAYVNGNPQWRTAATCAGSSIWIVNAEGGAPRPVLGDEYLNVSPTWLDARHLLFVSNRDGRARRVCRRGRTAGTARRAARRPRGGRPALRSRTRSAPARSPTRSSRCARTSGRIRSGARPPSRSGTVGP